MPFLQCPFSRSRPRFLQAALFSPQAKSQSDICLLLVQLWLQLIFMMRPCGIHHVQHQAFPVVGLQCILQFIIDMNRFSVNFLNPIANLQTGRSRRGIRQNLFDDGRCRIGCEVSPKIMRNASRKFMTGPAAITAIRAPTDLLRKEVELDAPSSASPSMRQKPPKGRIRILYSVSPLVREKIFGPMPTANSCTQMPFFFAIIKCPNSCAITRTPRSIMVINNEEMFSTSRQNYQKRTDCAYALPMRPPPVNPLMYIYI